MTPKDPWVRVRNESELRAGMAIRITYRDDILFGPHGTQNGILLRPGQDDPTHRTFHSGPCCPWSVTISYCDGMMCFVNAIATGRLYRLAPDATTDDAETTTAPKRRERVG